MAPSLSRPLIATLEQFMPANASYPSVAPSLLLSLEGFRAFLEVALIYPLLGAASTSVPYGLSLHTVEMLRHHADRLEMLTHCPPNPRLA